MALPIPQELTEYISIYNTTVPVQTEGTATADALFCNSWARITEGGGSYPGGTTQQNEEQVQAFEIIAQHVDGVRAWMQIQWGSRVLSITEPPQKIYDRYRRAWMVIRAEEVTERSL